MRANGWQGVRRVKKVRTTVPDPAAARAPDLVKRAVPGAGAVPAAGRRLHLRPDGQRRVRLHRVRDRRLRQPDRRLGVLDVETDPVRGVRDPPSRRRCGSGEGHPLLGKVIHHSDAGSQYTSVHFGETLLLNGMLPSIGTVGDAFDNALAETTIGLYKHECIRADSPFRRGPLDRLSRPGDDHRRLGALVQREPADAPPRPHPAGRGRSQLLCDNP